MNLPCGYEGPRGGGCDRIAKWSVSAGDFKTGPHAAAYCCEQHLDDVRAWVFRVVNVVPDVKPLPRQRQSEPFNRRDVAMLGGDPSL